MSLQRRLEARSLPAWVDEEEVERIFASAWSDSTRRVYSALWAKFVGWCKDERREEGPITEDTLIAYILWLKNEGCALPTIQSSLVVIRQGQERLGQPLPPASRAFSMFLRGLRREMAYRPAAKAALTFERLWEGLSVVSLSRWERALLLFGFATGCRREELVSLRIEDCESRDEGLLLNLRRSKTNQEGKEELIAIPCELRGFSEILGWLESRRKDRSEGWLFPSRNRPDGHLSSKTVVRLVKRLAEALQLDPARFGGHSLRAGVATSLAEEDASLIEIGGHLRHSDTRTTSRYVRKTVIFKRHPLRRLR